jgi:hypothetical protein
MCLKLEVLLDVTLYQLVTAIGVPFYARRLDLFYPEEEGIKILRNIRNYLPVETSNHQQNRYAKLRAVITKNKLTA